jgi:phenylpropionate dioxygenase-like ring-hydroxylating dioxygenase large terminal subunit
MIRNQWYVILESKEVKRGKPVGVTRLGEKLALWRMPDGKVACLYDRCAHLGARLSQGGVCSDEERLACPFHGFEYGSDGQCCHIPALGMKGIPPKAMRVTGYPTYEAHGLIWIYWGEPQPGLKPPRFFDMDGSFSYAGYHDLWPVHYSRMVENQLDVMHLPFVHKTTIGRGGRAVVDGPLYTLDDDILRLWVYNRLDDGTPPRKPDDIPAPARPPFLEFIFPNIWQNRITEDLRIFVAFVPVDEEHGLFYMRYYQRMVRLPVLRTLVNWAGVVASKVIADQDKRIVSNQLPKKTDLLMGEKVIQGDRIIVAYRRHRKELQEAAQANQ